MISIESGIAQNVRNSFQNLDSENVIKVKNMGLCQDKYRGRTDWCKYYNEPGCPKTCYFARQKENEKGIRISTEHFDRLAEHCYT